MWGFSATVESVGSLAPAASVGSVGSVGTAWAADTIGSAASVVAGESGAEAGESVVMVLRRSALVRALGGSTLGAAEELHQTVRPRKTTRHVIDTHRVSLMIDNPL